MAFLENNSLTGTIVAKPTRLGKLRLLQDGKLDITRFRLFDGEMNYQLLNPNNIDEDDPDMLSQSVSDGSENEQSMEYDYSEKSKGVLLNNPYFIRNQSTLVGNRLIDNPLYAQPQNLILDINSLSGSTDFSALLSPTASTTGVIAAPNTFYSATIGVTDGNGSAINGTVVSMYANNAKVADITVQDAVQVVFNNLTGNQNYKFVVYNTGFIFKNTEFGQLSYSVNKIQSNVNTRFLGTSTTYAPTTTYSVSGTLTNGISTSAVTGIAINIHYLNQSVTSSTDGSGHYSFTGLSGSTQYFLSINNTNYYYNSNASVTGTIAAANAVNNITLYPRSQFSGKVYYYNTTNPISNAVLNLYQGTTAGLTNNYVGSVVSDQNGFFIFDNILLQNNYNITAGLQGYSFVNLPLQYGASSVTGSLTSIVVYGKKDERPIQPDTPFPKRHKLNALDDKSDLPIFYDPCSWAFSTLKLSTLNFATNYKYSPIRHDQVLRSTNYQDLITSLQGPYTFMFNTNQNGTSAIGNPTATPYVSDSYTIKVCLYALPYQYSLQESLPLWDTTSKSDRQATFPQQINQNATGIQFNVGDKKQFVEITPSLQNQSLAISFGDIHKILSLLPQEQVLVPITVDENNTIPNLGLYHAHDFNLDPSILNIQLTPFELAQNGDYVQYASIKGEERQIPVEVVVDDFEEIVTDSLQNAIDKQSFHVLGNPLPIFMPLDGFLRNGMLNNNLRYSFGFSDLISIIQQRGLVLNRIIQWDVTVNEYNISRESAYLTVNTVDSSKTVEQILFTVDGSHYNVSQEFYQFLISYFGIPSTDQNTINSLLKGKALVDWLFYAFVINCGAFYNSYNDGSLQTLLSIGASVRYGILNDIVVSGKSVVDAASDAVKRQYQPTQSTLSSPFFQVLASSATPVGQISPITGANTNISKAPDGATAPANVSAFQPAPFNSSPNQQFTPTQPLGPTGVNAPTLPIGSSQNPNNFVQIGPSLQPVLPVTPSVGVQTNTNISNYAYLLKRIAEAITLNKINDVLRILYALLAFDYKLEFFIVIKTIRQTVIHNTVKRPIKKVTVTTQTISPIACRVITVNNANNYFNFNPSLEKKLSMTLQFDLTRPEAQDNFIKMINYLNAQLYTVWLGVEIIDNGNITQTINSGVKQLTEYVNAPLDVQKALCLNDKVQFMIPLTIGGIKTTPQMTTTSDPTTFNGTGIIKYAPYVPTTGGTTPNVAHIVRIIKLSNIAATDTRLVNNNIISGSDYIAYDVLQVDTSLNLDYIRLIPRFMQILDKYNLSLANLDLAQLRKVLANEYSTIAGVSYVGAVGPTFGSSTKPPIFWNSSIVEWTNGATPLAMLDRILGAGKVVNVGQVITNINDFTVIV